VSSCLTYLDFFSINAQRAALATTGTTLAIYMGMDRLESISAALMQHLPASTPAAVVQAASLPQEARLLTTLGRLAIEARQAGLGSPGVILIGAALAEAVQPAMAVPLQVQVHANG